MSWRRLRLRRADGRVYLNRWGWRCRFGAVLLHRMDAPDPGEDLHDHPWAFVSIVLAGGYIEERAATRDATTYARIAVEYLDTPLMRGARRGFEEERRRFSVRRMRLDECHRITRLLRAPTWTLVITGPRRRRWGFYLPDGWMEDVDYDDLIRPSRRDLWADDFELKR